MKIYKKSIWKTPPFWAMSFILLTATSAILLGSEAISFIFLGIFFVLWTIIKVLWYIGFDDIGMYRFHYLRKGPVDLYKYEDIETVSFFKLAWSTTLMIKKKNGEKKYCSLALINRKDIKILEEELKQYGVDVD